MVVEITKANIEERVVDIIKKMTNSTIMIALNESLDCLQIDSIRFIKIIIALEDEFDIEFEDDKLIITSFNTVGDLTVYLSEIIGV